jgi:hypothetical protein
MLKARSPRNAQRKQRDAYHECQVHPEPHAKPAALQVAAQSRDDRLDHESMNDQCA